MSATLRLRGFSGRIANRLAAAEDTEQQPAAAPVAPVAPVASPTVPPDRYRDEPIIHHRSVKRYKCLCGQLLSFPVRKSGAPPCKAMRCPVCQQSHWR